VLARPNKPVERDRFAHKIVGILTISECARGGSRAGRWGGRTAVLLPKQNPAGDTDTT
jgi:hypothetical protein